MPLKDRLSGLVPRLSHGSGVGLSALLSGFPLGKRATAVGLDIGSRHLKVAVLAATERGIVIEQVAERALPPAMVSGTTILDPEGVTEEVVRLFEEMNIRRPRVTTMVGGNDVFVRRVAMQRMGVQEAIRQLPQNQSLRLPIDPAQNKLDLVILDPQADTPTMQTLVVAARKESISIRQRIILEARAALHAVDVDAFALFNVFEHCHADLLKERATLVEIGYETSIIVIVDRGLLSVARHADLGVSHLIEQLSSSNMLPNEAEHILRSSNPPAIYPDAFRVWGGRLLDEVRRSMSGFRNEGNIGPIYISGGGARIDGLAAFLQDRIDTPVSVFDPFTSMTVGTNVSLRGNRDGATYALAVGLALRQLI